jgi:hypothetical protein
VELFRQRLEALRLRREERRALLRAGAAAPPSPEIAALEVRLATLRDAPGLALQRDRDDYAAAPPWARGLVVLRGLLDNGVTAALAHQARRARDQACVIHGAANPDAAALEARRRREEAEALLRPLPPTLREASSFGRQLGRYARGQLVPRVPGLVGLVVGWWIAQTFTDSELSATLHGWGLGSGPRHAVRSETLKALTFWGPLLAGALSSYLGSRLGAYVRRRYAPVPAAEPQANAAPAQRSSGVQ